MAMTWFPGNDPKHGYTLAELLTVIAIISLIGGLGAGAYQMARRNYALQASAGRIQGILRAARNSALTTGNPALVVVDPASRRVAAQAFERVGEWSFEEGPAESGPAGISADAPAVISGGGANRGGKSVPGRVGRGLSFRSPGACFECGAEARFDLRTGILVEAWVRHSEEQRVGRQTAPGGSPRTAQRAGQRRGRVQLETSRENKSPPWVILKKDGAYALGMTSMGALEGSIGAYRVRTDDGTVPPDRWVRIDMRFDGRRIELGVDGVPRETAPALEGGSSKAMDGATTALPASAPVTAAQLTISDPHLPFPGDIDEVRLSGATEPLEYVWPEHERVLGWKKVIHFDRRGHLDAAFHREPIRLVLVELPDEVQSKPAGTTEVVVDYSVTFEEWRARFEKPEALTREAEEARLEAAHASARQTAIAVDRLGVVH